MKIVTLASILSLILMLGACATAVDGQRYQPRQDALIKFINGTQAPGNIEMFEQAEECRDRYLQQDIAAKKSIDHVLPAGRPRSFSLGYRLDNFESCTVYITFTPEPGKQYYAKIHDLQDRCGLDLFEELLGRKVAVQFEVRRGVAGRDNADQFCEDRRRL